MGKNRSKKPGKSKKKWIPKKKNMAEKARKKFIFLGFGKKIGEKNTKIVYFFGSLEKMRKATDQELREVEGIGPKLAAQLKNFLETGKL